MKRLTINALKEKALQITNEELMSKISGGTENDCHDSGVGGVLVLIEPEPLDPNDPDN